MRRAGPITAVLIASAFPTLAVGTAHAADTLGHGRPILLARGGGGHFGGSHFGGGRSGRSIFGSGRRSIFGSSRSRRGLLHRIARVLALAYIAHLLFSHGGLSILLWIAIIALVVMLWRWRRRRRFAY
jgi:hypothetical protein